jgi:hypothetical protein
VPALPTATYPATSLNRTRNKVASEILSYIGSPSDKDMIARCGDCWDEAVRSFNALPWKFNRVSENITLLASTNDYTLTGLVRDPFHARLLDSQARAIDDIPYVPFDEYVRAYYPLIGTSNLPQIYTMPNRFETGQVTLWPPLGAGTFPYPTIQFNYHRYIQTQQIDSGVLSVPQDVDQAIFMFARALMLHKQKGAVEARVDYQLALDFRQAIEREHRDWGDNSESGQWQ